LLEFASFAGGPSGKVEQIAVACDKVRGFGRESQVNINLIVRIAGKMDERRHMLD